MRTLDCSLAARDPRRIAAAICGWEQFAAIGLPNWVSLDGKDGRPTSWREDVVRADCDGAAVWEFGEEVARVCLLPGSDLFAFTIPDAFESMSDALGMLEPLPFEIGALGSVFYREWIESDYRRWGFARSHIDHGWGCAFRGAGHDRLVSRRWLDFGPWRVIRRPNDTTFIQFHDLSIPDPAEAYEQAKVGHQRMGVDPIGGFIQGINLDVIAQVQGLYRAESRTLEIVVAPGTEVSQQDMRVACGLRLHHRLTRPAVDRIEHIAYVFIDKADAMAHLHELWLRELECWYLDERGKHRLDADYHPTPNPPAWVRALEAREARGSRR